MKLLSIANAQSAWLFPTSDINPRGKSLLPILEAVVKRYRFKCYPQTVQDLSSENGFTFEGGIYESTPDEKLGIRLRMYNDGLVANALSSTEDCDSFLHDLLTWVSDEFGFLPYKKVLRRKIYASELYIHLDSPLSLVNPAVTEFASLLSQHGYDKGQFPFELSGLAFGKDPEKIQGRSTSFRLERADNVNFSENRYYCTSHFPTKTHLALLEKLERALSK